MPHFHLMMPLTFSAKGFRCTHPFGITSPNKVLFLEYEHVKREPWVHVRQLAEFLELPLSAEEENEGIVEKIVKLCSFENLSNLDVNKIVKEEKIKKHFINSPDFFRKGQVGD
ncbi:hypothetical protein COLO4_27327 [Corchorus olitorius]|uniref:Sulfotransferase n=1 Tax=Corchorus olitorius TaxID=93759 RepID=A0A1R3HRH3_9ROSI|nr:hypothetical protein COLO4_27327 [Corchorus olitorius]